MSSEAPNSAPAAALLLILLGFSATTLVSYSTGHQTNQAIATMDGLQVRSASLTVGGLHRSSLTLDLSAVVFNSNPIGATLQRAVYSISVDGRYLGTGETLQQFSIEPESSGSFVFPISLRWSSAVDTGAIYLANLGNVSWQANGSATVSLGSLSFSTPFEFKTG